MVSGVAVEHGIRFCYSSNYPILSLSSCSCWTSLEAWTWLHI